MTIRNIKRTFFLLQLDPTMLGIFFTLKSYKLPRQFELFQQPHLQPKLKYNKL